jgi:hypothetical protein
MPLDDGQHIGADRQDGAGREECAKEQVAIFCRPYPQSRTVIEQRRRITQRNRHHELLHTNDVPIILQRHGTSDASQVKCAKKA